MTLVNDTSIDFVLFSAVGFPASLVALCDRQRAAFHWDHMDKFNFANTASKMYGKAHIKPTNHVCFADQAIRWCDGGLQLSIPVRK